MNFRTFLNAHKTAVIIFCLAAAVRLALFFAYLNVNHGDFTATIWGVDGYSDIAKNLVLGNGYSEASAPPYLPNSLRPPAWIFLIALLTKVSGSYVPIFVVQLVMSCLVPIIGMYLGGKIIPGRYATAVGVLLALEPAAVFSTTMLATETSFTFLFLLFVALLFRYLEARTTRAIVWSAVCLGLAILIKPTVEFLPVFIPAVLLLLYRKELSAGLLKHAALFFAVCMLVIAPWVYRNYEEFGVFGLTSQAAYNLYTVLVPTVLSIDTGTSYEQEHLEIQNTIPKNGGGITLANADFYTAKAVAIFSAHKTAFVKSLAISVVTFFTHDHMLTVLGYGGIAVPNLLDKPALVLLFTHPAQLAQDIARYAASPGICILLGRLFWIAVAFLFFAGAWLYVRREKFSPFACMAIFLVAYFAVFTAANGFGMNGRFRIPVNAFIFTFALYGFFALRSAIRDKGFS